MKPIKPIVMVSPVSQRHVDGMGGDPRSPLAKASYEHIEALITERPEVRLVLAVLWTPRPDDHPSDQMFDDTHTCVVGEIELETLIGMIDQVLPTLVELRVKLAQDPSQVFPPRKESS